jgi:hypothetical protein
MEKADIFRAGLESTRYQQIDDTGAKAKWQNHCLEIICNPFYIAYFTISHRYGKRFNYSTLSIRLHGTDDLRKNIQ